MYKKSSNLHYLFKAELWHNYSYYANGYIDKSKKASLDLCRFIE